MSSASVRHQNDSSNSPAGVLHVPIQPADARERGHHRAGARGGRGPRKPRSLNPQRQRGLS
jgi:hypothetical protein